MFDPFGDFESAGYLRNVLGEKDSRIIKRMEHDLFDANVERAVEYLSSVDEFVYNDFLEVHRILFVELYPWAGKDRMSLCPTIGVSKGGVLFARPEDARYAVIEGLRLGQIPEEMNRHPGEVMGLFAYGHPFLDGNGRTMLIVHSLLCDRAGFSIDWAPTNIVNLREELVGIKGLDGLDDAGEVEGDLREPEVEQQYREFERRRGYKIDAAYRHKGNGYSGPKF